MFDPVPVESLNEREEKVLAFWEKNKIFERSLSEREGSPFFSFYDGPPFATGLPHYGHLLAGTIKDVVPRYKTMRGFYVPRRFGWDCHGLPVENEIEKEENLSGAASIQEYGIPKFNEACRSIVLRYSNEWKTIVKRTGRFVDFENTYKTMDLPFMESVWWVFKEIYDKGLVYEGFKVMPFSAKLGTPLSNFEASENYKEVDDPALTVAFPLVEDPETSLLIWTTTPWTLVSNLAIMVGPNIEYVKVKNREDGKKYIVAKNRVGVVFSDGEIEVLETFLGSTLYKKEYVPLFDYFKEEKAFYILLEESVSIEEGTGLVHSAPAFGEVDFYACKKEGIELVCPVDNNGQFTDKIPEYEGMFVKLADKDIAKRIKEKKRLFHQATCRHRYPFCWRSDTPLIYKAVSTWFVAVEKIKKDILEAAQEIHWVPGHIKQGRFGKWLEGARDWAISRKRYFGTPIPIYRNEEGDIHVVGSIKELEELTGTSITDIHRHFIDHLTFQKEGKTYTRITEVFDCWFESGSMPYAQNHYPFENKELFNQQFPADFIAEGLDQTRGWFYTLTVLAAALFKKPAFKHVVVNGIILAEDGNKMSKRLKNYPDPMAVIHKYGADAVRLYMMQSPAVKAEDLCFSEGGVELVLRQVLIPFWNSYSFFMTYARIYNFRPNYTFSNKKHNLIDQFILSRLNRLKEEVIHGMDQYHLDRAVEPFIGFVESLTNWYIRRSRRRFWEEEDSQDRREAFETLYTVLLEMCHIAAPFIPFMAESMYQNLRQENMPESIHLAFLTDPDLSLRDEGLEEGMQAIQEVVSLGHALRKEHKVKVRQPLPSAIVVNTEPDLLLFLESQKHLIQEELNVKEVFFEQEESKFVDVLAKPNFRVLGKKVGKAMREVQEAILKLQVKDLETLEKEGSLNLSFGSETIQLVPEDVEIQRKAKEGEVILNRGSITVALSLNITPELFLEGISREIVNKINTMRKESGFAVTDRIVVFLETTPLVREAFEKHKEYIVGETLIVDIQPQIPSETSFEVWDLNGETAKIALEKFKK